MCKRILCLCALLAALLAVHAQPSFHYRVSVPRPSSHKYHVELHTAGWSNDTVVFKMPKWMPGYYQIMDYGKFVENVMVKDVKGKMVPFERISDNNVRVVSAKKRSLVISYDVATLMKFVASSYVDSAHAYLVTTGSFFYVDGHLNTPVKVEIQNPWIKVATGLTAGPKANQFSAPDFDVLYDCPILMGDLEELPPVMVRGVEHRFIGYKLGQFDKADFMDRLQRMTGAAVEIIGDIPFKQYTFIAIGPGMGGIEHLNNTTVSFSGTELKNPGAMSRILFFLAHEYFHHYNVKRIRPFELGPFDYERGSKTNLLWLSEGFSVYYEYLIVKRAGLADQQELFSALEGNINNTENNPGRAFQSLTQASYNTWKDGPFGTGGDEKGKTISYYEKGPVVGLLMDFAIRHATQNKRSLDDVMRTLYWRYYKEKGRGFTDGEMQQAAEEVAGASLKEIFEYIYTTKELDYAKYLGYGGLKLEETKNADGTRMLRIVTIDNPDSLQRSIFNSWLNGK
jgi:predicted metalloprotease with PDZ domain